LKSQALTVHTVCSSRSDDIGQASAVSMPRRVGGLGHGSEGGDVDDREILLPQSDQRSPQLSCGMVVVLPRFESVRPTDPHPQD
jgi:hypothetical protein